MFTSQQWMHGIASRSSPPQYHLGHGQKKELCGPITDHRLCGSQWHSLVPPCKSYAVTNSSHHKITAGFSFHRFLCAGQFTTPTDSTFNPTIRMALGNVSWHLTQPEAQTTKTNQAGRSTIVLLPRTADASCPTAQCYDTGGISPLPVLSGHPLPIHGWPPTVQCGMQIATLQASPQGWIYQATLYNTHSSRIGVATTTTTASTTSN